MLFGTNHPWFVPNKWSKFEENCLYHIGSVDVALKVYDKELKFYMLLIFSALGKYHSTHNKVCWC